MHLRPLSLLTALAATSAAALAQNDECATATTLTAGVALPFDTSSASLSAPAWPCAGASTSPDLWYVFTATVTATHRFETCGSSYDTALQVFSGSCAALTSVACNDDSCQLSSRVEVPLNAGDVRYIRVGGFGANSIGAGTILAEPLVPAAPSLVAHYPLDDTNTTCADISGNNIVGVYNGGTRGQAGAAPGTGSSVSFNGAGDHVEIFGVPQLDQLIQDFTAMTWFRASALPVGTAVQRLFGNQGPGGSWSFGLRGNVGLRFTTHAVLDYDVPVVLNAGQWYHLAVAMDIGNDVTFYLNGAPIGTVAGTLPARTPNTSYMIGAWNPPGTIPEFFNGNLDDVQVYEGVLTPAQIQQLFNNPGTSLGSNSGIGTTYCSPAVANSTGQPAAITAAGSIVAATNNVTLTARQLPLNAFGFFLTSRTQGAINQPGGSQGVLCLTGSIGRYVGPGQIRNSGATGEFSLALNLTQHPTPSGFVSVLAGDTWNFTAWYRDAVGGVATSNFTNGRSILFQ